MRMIFNVLEEYEITNFFFLLIIEIYRGTLEETNKISQLMMCQVVNDK
jgi:hypothetical protein